jgi:hypothetical protein
MMGGLWQGSGSDRLGITSERNHGEIFNRSITWRFYKNSDTWSDSNYLDPVLGDTDIESPLLYVHTSLIATDGTHQVRPDELQLSARSA